MDLGDVKVVADPDSRRQGGGLALQAGGLPARHSMNGSVCVIEWVGQRGIRES